MRLYPQTGLTGYAASVIDEQLSATEQVALLRAHQDDPDGLVTELRRLVATKAVDGVDAEFAATALDAVAWEQIVAALAELTTVEVRLPCGHEEARFQSFGGYDARHGEREVVETFEHACATCQQVYDVLVTSTAQGAAELRRRLVFTTRPQQAVYVERLQFNAGDELPKCSSGQWKQGSPYQAQPARA